MSIDRNQLEIQIHSEPRNLRVLCPLAEIYLAENKLERAGKLVDTALKEYLKNPGPLDQGISVLDVALKMWKADRFVSKGSLHLNLSPSRRKTLADIVTLCTALNKIKDRDNFQSLNLKVAYVREASGSFEDALTLLSDLITIQASDGVDLSYIIFKAAILLRHIGHVKQSIEYLEFLQDDPPAQDGFSRVHVLAYLTTAYEISGDKYKVFLGKAYRDLAAAIAIEADPKTQTASSAKQYKRLDQLAKAPAFTSASDLWEVFALQALERCEYVLAADFLQIAINKAPGKGNLQHWLAEVYWLLNEKDNAEKVAEKAFELIPESAELRDLLLQISPEVWTERIRFLGMAKKENKAGASSSNANNNNRHNKASSSSSASAVAASAGGLVNRLRSSAATAMQSVIQGSFPLSSSRPSSPEKPPTTTQPVTNANTGSGDATAQEDDNHHPDSNKNRSSSPPQRHGSNSRPGSRSAQSQAQETIAGSQSSNGRKGSKQGSSYYRGRPERPLWYPTTSSTTPAATTSEGDEEQTRQLQREATRIHRLALQGNAHVHYYAEELRDMAQIQRGLQRQREVEAQRLRVLG